MEEKETPGPTIGIISLGEMGLGIARLLQTFQYNVATTLDGRSPSTVERARSADIAIYPLSIMVDTVDIILSIVPPESAISTAESVLKALESDRRPISNQTSNQSSSGRRLIYCDLNAVSPSTSIRVAELFTFCSYRSIQCIDGGILGGPPTLNNASDALSIQAWSRPRIPLSGPTKLPNFPSPAAPDLTLSAILNIKHISDELGRASGLKCCFASLLKGFQALALQSFSTAESMGILNELDEALDDMAPEMARRVKRGVSVVPRKAWRWIWEMEQIGECFGETGGWDEAHENSKVFANIAGVFDVLATQTEVGKKREEGEWKRNVQELSEAVNKGAG
ncbi:6-phosphogluconate dehydrogenase C-terminal domain-like protein [Eremomyces bilateralis CBS 781.70]|uniref:6-phosphogluconate dehydrogenase C-terminal domain-like protein n=1 Tax=Eremomyces bilateralis CBS 781.70 TaxID=1392243 RepID=A0A6G1GAL3_9PEZI|nr:6-phosphogluconate dehydrogenase C-terminal domain-like protein [Eremomyces bilateralis CBS 781.70]KAF1815073.1 6-phosphogluconate dehydrogenase C-terminal domain-like protein [Eremomyces bilateralis CBS 781.70]